MEEDLRILLIDDNLDDRVLVMRELEREFPGLEVEQVMDGPGLQDALEAGGFDLVITDYQLHWTDGLAVLRAVKERWPGCPVIMFTAKGTEEVAVEAMKTGLDDYILKSPKHYARLPAAVRPALKSADERRERKQAEARYRDLYENAPVAYLSINLDGEILDCNRAAEDFFGYSREELRKRGVFDLYAEESREKAGRVFEKFKTGLPVENEEMVYCRKNGATAQGLLSVSPIKDKNGNIVANRLVVVDVTEIKRVEQELRESRETARAILDATDDSAFLIKPDGTILAANQTAARRLGVEVKELVGKNGFEFIPPDVAAGRRAVVEEVVKTGRAAELEDERGGMHFRSTSYPLFDSRGKVDRVAVFTRDITAMKRAEEARLREREMAQTYLDVARVMLLALDSNGRVTLINKRGCEILGYEEKEIIGKDWFDNFLPQRLRDETRGVFKRIMAGELELFEHHENPVLCSGGEEKLIAWHNATLKDEGGNIIGTLSSGEDITERKRAEEELRESEERYATLFRRTSSPILVINNKGDYVDCNEAALEFMECTRDQLLAMNVRDTIPPGKEEQALEEHKPLWESGGVAETEYYIKGKTKFLELTITPMMMRGERVIMGIGKDITASRKARERLERLNHLFLSLGVDLIGNMERIIETGRDILGGELVNYCRMERGRLICALSTAPGEVLKPAERPEDRVCHQVIRGDGQPLAIEDLDKTGYPRTDPYVRKYGLKSFLGFPVVLERRIIGCLSLFDTRRRGFTHEEKEILGTLARALAIEEERLVREESMKDFIDIASHELRHPVTLMKGYAISLKELRDRLDQQQVKEMLEAIDRGAERLNRLVLGLLDLSRIERGRFRIDRREAELSSIIEQAIGELQGGGLKNEFELSNPDEIETARVDPERLVELLLILLENAAKFSPPASRIDVEVVPAEGGILVSVLDRGMGVPEDYRELVFERFVQVEDALHHSIPGMGMGLYIAREIVEAHGGKIWCEPREGGGTAFRFTLPS